jgi:mRNA interferase HigB
VEDPAGHQASVFKGNEYRLVVAVAYRFAALYIKFVGTHAEYDAIHVATVENQT